MRAGDAQEQSSGLREAGDGRSLGRERHRKVEQVGASKIGSTPERATSGTEHQAQGVAQVEARAAAGGVAVPELEVPDRLGVDLTGAGVQWRGREVQRLVALPLGATSTGGLSRNVLPPTQRVPLPKGTLVWVEP